MAADDESNQNNPQVNGSTPVNSVVSQNGTTTSSRAEEFRAAAVARQNAVGTGSPESSPLADGAQSDGLQGTDGSAAAVAKKLQQVRGYIQQTSTAMEGLEQQADMDKIGQYNTLVKVLKDLKTSETKLQAHLGSLPGGMTATDGSNNGATQESVPNSQSIGQVSSMTVDRVDSVPESAPSNMSQRLEAGMEEANQLTDRLRESVARREDLVERYRNTRERLAALKRQRRDIIQQERTVLVAHSNRESPYEDAIPGANYWNLEELNTGLRDFRTLYDKVNALRTAYINRSQVAAEGDSEAAPPDVSAQLSQLDNKKTQLVAIIAQLKRLKAAKLREQGLDPEDEPEEEPVPEEPSIPVDSNSTSSVNASIAAAIEAASAPVISMPLIAPSVVNALSNSTSAQPQQDAADSTSGESKVGGSVSMGLNDAPVSAVLAARAQMVAAGQELAIRTQHLNNLKEELSGMKRLLETTVNKRNALRDNAGASQQSSSSSPDTSSTSEARASQDERSGEYITGVSGNVLHLSDLERQDPAVIAKYKQLSEAKQRMAQMEEIMKIIQASRGSGRSLSELLNPEQLQLLQQAQAEDEEPCPPRDSQATASAPAVSDVPQSLLPPATTSRGSSRDIEDAPVRAAAQSQRSNQIVGRDDQLSAMQQHLTKTQPMVKPVNEETKYRRPKEPVDKQDRWESRGPLEDPRITEIMTLQEELKQKKNAMEDLMRGMGKPSFLHPDNISDNISESDSLPPSPRRRTERRDRGAEVLYDGSVPPCLRLPTNNLWTASAERSVRPKQNRASVGPATDNYRSNNLGRATSQQPITEALNQLNSMQGSIDSMYDALRSEQEARQAPAAAQQPKQQLHHQMQRLHQKQQMQQQIQMQQMQQPFNMFGLPQTPMLPGLPMDVMTVPMLSSSLQQCFSQLYLHSLEIQSLNKHIQVRQQQQMQQLMLYLQMQANATALLPSLAPSPYMGMLGNVPSLYGGMSEGVGMLPHSLPNFGILNPSSEEFDDTQNETEPKKSRGKRY